MQLVSVRAGRRSLVTAVLIGSMLTLGGPGSVAAYGQDVFTGHGTWDQTQQTKCTCVPASARLWLRYFRSDVPSQQTLHQYMAPRDKFANWDNYACPANAANLIQYSA